MHAQTHTYTYTHFASRTKAIIPATRGAAALVPVKDLVQPLDVVVLTCMHYA